MRVHPVTGPRESKAARRTNRQQGGKTEKGRIVLEHDAPRSEVLQHRLRHILVVFVAVNAAAELDKVVLGSEFRLHAMFGAIFGGGHVRPEAPFSVNGPIWEALFSVSGPISSQLEPQWLRVALLL